MKRVAYLIVALVQAAVLSAMFAGLVHAAIALTVNLNDTYQARLEEDLVRSNRETCRRLWRKVVVENGGAAPWTPRGTCTQAQACAAAGAAGGASCTNQQADEANARIFPATQNGREALAQVLLREVIDERRAQRDGKDLRQGACDWWETQTLSVRQNECLKYGAPQSCDLRTVLSCD
jgi:hypothetical protein